MLWGCLHFKVVVFAQPFCSISPPAESCTPLSPACSLVACLKSNKETTNFVCMYINWVQSLRDDSMDPITAGSFTMVEIHVVGNVINISLHKCCESCQVNHTLEYLTVYWLPLRAPLCLWSTYTPSVLPWLAAWRVRCVWSTVTLWFWSGHILDEWFKMYWEMITCNCSIHF